jgi:hypothetical protein
MTYQNPTKFEETIELFEFDLPRNGTGNYFVTYAEWTDKWGENCFGYHDGADGRWIPDHIRLQIALQIAGDLVVAK